jgi:hypothetical protein
MGITKRQLTIIIIFFLYRFLIAVGELVQFQPKLEIVVIGLMARVKMGQMAH